MSECSHNCSSCGENCPSRQSPESFLEKPNEMSSIKKVIGIVSGKGGVGKSMVTSILATLLRRKDYGVAIMDADITGPSIP
ncbi:MAG: P-loop NTPase, partial [Candidatus Faecivivens sp.]|nr:P-loop NTPase [Candidatus Faecivivens sp.]